MFPEKHQAIAVNFDGTPGVRLHPVGEVLFPLLQAQLIGAAINMFRDPAHGSGIGINGLFTLPLQFEQTEVTLVKLIESNRFSLIHRGLRGAHQSAFPEASRPHGLVPHNRIHYDARQGVPVSGQVCKQKDEW
jgi:hypothetical protein